MPNRDSTSAPLNFDPEHQGIFHPTKIVVTTGFELPGPSLGRTYSLARPRR